MVHTDLRHNRDELPKRVEDMLAENSVEYGLDWQIWDID
jgi:hypothetical protein